MADAFIQKAKAFEGQAVKKLKSANGFFNKIFGSSQEIKEEASDLYQQSGLNYKLGKQNQKAAQMYIEASKIQQQTEDGEPTESLLEAANLLLNIDVNQSLEIFDQAIGFTLDKGRIAQGGKIKKQVIEALEKQAKQAEKNKNMNYIQILEKIIEKCDDGMELFSMEQGYSYEVSKLRIKKAEYIYQCEFERQEIYQNFMIENMIKGIQAFETQANEYLTQSLTAGSAKKLFFQAALGYLTCDDCQGALNKIEEFERDAPQFANCDEFQMVQQISATLENKDKKAYQDLYLQFEARFPMNPLLKYIFEFLNKKLTVTKMESDFL